MCLILTVCAAVAATLAWYLKANMPALKLGVLTLMYWGAALMWTVDGFYALAAGEAFLEISLSDTLLGIVVVLCGLAAWMLYLLAGKCSRVLAHLYQK